jgi:hypothetical protein
MLMNASRLESISPPPGVISSLRAGFDTIAAHITAILLPVILDLWLWLGPRLSIKDISRSLEMQTEQDWKALGVSAAQLQSVKEWSEASLSALDSINLAALLRAFPIGISSLMSGIRPIDTPLGAPVVLQMESVAGMLGWMALLTLIGWLGGYLYFLWVASLVMQDAKPNGSQLGNLLLQSLIISMAWAALSLVVGPPLMLTILFTAAIPMLQFVVMLLLGFLSMWLVVPLFFSPVGIFVRRQNLFSAILSGLQLARFTLPSSSLFVLCILLISMGLNLVWSLPPSESWVSLVGIFGHAFISTALLAASFIYYRDMTAWLQVVLERIKAGPAAPQA